MKQEVLVVGGRGRVGRELLRVLSAQGTAVRSLVRTFSKEPLLAKVREVQGDLAERSSLAKALEGVQSAFFVTPHAENEEQLGVHFIEEAERAGVTRLVFASAFHADFSSPLLFSVFVGAMGLFTHYGPKMRVERRVRQSKASPVVLMPSNFFQNDEVFLPELRQGIYPQPLGLRGVNRVDCRDIADAAARALTDLSLASGAYPLVGPEEALTGPDCAAVWAQALGRAVVYQGDLVAWRSLVRDRLHERESADFEKTYKLFARMRLPASAADRERCAKVLGHAPRSYASYVQSVLEKD